MCFVVYEVHLEPRCEPNLAMDRKNSQGVLLDAIGISLFKVLDSDEKGVGTQGNDLRGYTLILLLCEAAKAAENDGKSGTKLRSSQGAFVS
jgi:hypothetical protein